MRLNSNDICSEFPDPEKMKSINDVLFSEIKEMIQDVPNLIIDLPPLGKWYYRKAKTKNYLNSPRVFDETREFANKVLNLYKEYDEDKLQVQYEKFGKEAHEAYLLAKKQGKISKFQKTNSE